MDSSLGFSSSPSVPGATPSAPATPNPPPQPRTDVVGAVLTATPSSSPQPGSMLGTVKVGTVPDPPGPGCALGWEPVPLTAHCPTADPKLQPEACPWPAFAPKFRIFSAPQQGNLPGASTHFANGNEIKEQGETVLGSVGRSGSGQGSSTIQPGGPRERCLGGSILQHIKIG